MMHCVLLLLVLACSLAAGERIEVDFTAARGSFKPLNGVNKGPLAPGGLLDVSADFARLEIPYVRLHDCHWPNPDVVDIHVIFPNPDADPALESSYDFRLTDPYLQSIRAVGAQIIYRLGESIEHTELKRFVHPPKDPEKWARICLGVIRHYNEGWSAGPRLNIKYWEIWNEPENRPAMWSGTDDDYLNLYRISSKAIKASFPALKVGGPALGSSGSFKNGQFISTPFLRRFLETCRAEKLPLDFFSWHCYSDQPEEFANRATAIRSLLNEYGFTDTENHLNEWNYLPGNDWKPIMRGAVPLDRERFYSRMSGPAGAAFVGATVILLQQTPLDLATFFHGEVGAFGLFNEFGVPNTIYAAFAAIAELMASQKAAVHHPEALPSIASFAPGRGTVLVANWKQVTQPVVLLLKLPAGNWRIEAESLGFSPAVSKSIEQGRITLELPGRSLTRFRVQAQ